MIILFWVLGIFTGLWAVWFAQAFIRINWTDQKHYDVKITQRYGPSGTADGSLVYIKTPYTYSQFLSRRVLTKEVGGFWTERNSEYVKDGDKMFKHSSGIAKAMIEKDMKFHQKPDTVSFTFRTDTGTMDNMKGPVE